MTFSRAEVLALRRRLLVLDAAIQRLQLRHDAVTLMAAAHPANIASRWWQRTGKRALLMRVIGLWQLWRRLRPTA
jgi:hypothetical protein